MTDAINETMLLKCLDLAKEFKASAVVLFLDAADDWAFWKKIPNKKKLVLITQKDEFAADLENFKKEVKHVLKLPRVKLTRLGQIKLTVIMCLTEGVFKNNDRIICLTGAIGGGILDTMMAIDLSKETEVFTTRAFTKGLLRHVKPEVLEAVLNIAIELSSEGREGKAIGAMFVIGDHEKVAKLSKPLIMNPFKGYPEESRNILDTSVHETIKEFSLLDGAFIVREDGVVMAAGVHIDAALENEGLIPGLGCRHMAAAGITDVTGAAAVSISGSTGIVRIFSQGKIILELEKPVKGAEGQG
ncbi:MAG: DNA integrity scanning protein DisA nucleotide-binding domain protein [Deltaproteobacteria bacterium]|nr:DNA integrity scanning protein DisA nucleotide-binding domain protein [Deltaproteobacteria bacterium]